MSESLGAPLSYVSLDEPAPTQLMARTWMLRFVMGGVTLGWLLTTCLSLSLAPASSFRSLGETESQVVFIAVTLQIGNLCQDLMKGQLSESYEITSTKRCILLTKVLSLLSNLIFLIMPTPHVSDPMTGRAQALVRWCEWTVLAFMMTFVVEAIDSSDPATALATGAAQSISTLCGLFLPAASALPPVWGLPVAWGGLLVVSFLLYFVLFARLAAKHRKLQRMRASLPPTCYPLVRAELGMRLFWAMMFTWTGLTAVWTADAIAGKFVARGATSWAFIADCAIDCIAKALYTTAIVEQADTATQQADMQKEAKKRARLHW